MKMTSEDLIAIIEVIYKKARETKKESQENPMDEFASGRNLAYFEVLDTIKNRLEGNGAELRDYGLDSDLVDIF